MTKTLTLRFKAPTGTDEEGVGTAVVYDEAARDLDKVKLRASGITWRLPLAMLWQHDMGDPGNVIGRFTELERVGTKIVGVFRLDLTNDRARKVRDGMKAGTIREFSVSWTMDEEDVEERADGTVVIRKSELIEISAVVKGANEGTELRGIKRAWAPDPRRVVSPALASGRSSNMTPINPAGRAHDFREEMAKKYGADLVRAVLPTREEIATKAERERTERESFDQRQLAAKLTRPDPDCVGLDGNFRPLYRLPDGSLTHTPARDRDRQESEAERFREREAERERDAAERARVEALPPADDVYRYAP